MSDALSDLQKREVTKLIFKYVISGGILGILLSVLLAIIAALNVPGTVANKASEHAITAESFATSAKESAKKAEEMSKTMMEAKLVNGWPYVISCNYSGHELLFTLNYMNFSDEKFPGKSLYSYELIFNSAESNARHRIVFFSESGDVAYTTSLDKNLGECGDDDLSISAYGEKNQTYGLVNLRSETKRRNQ